MDQYASYIQKLKHAAPKTDFERLYHKIEARRNRPSFNRPLVSLAVITILILFTLPFIPIKNNSPLVESRLTSYVFQNTTSGNYVVADYILSD